MKKSSIFTAVATALALSSGAMAAENNMMNMEKCKVIDKDGKGLIKAHKSDCKSSSHSCAGQNKAGDPDSWIMVPKGECAKINAGDFSEVHHNIKDKIESAK